SLGLYGMLGMCRSWSAGGIWPTPEQLWAKVNVMPWASLGMMVGGNVGVALDLDPIAAGVAMVAAMLLGMILGMNALLAAARALSFLSASPARRRDWSAG